MISHCVLVWTGSKQNCESKCPAPGKSEIVGLNKHVALPDQQSLVVFCPVDKKGDPQSDWAKSILHPILSSPTNIILSLIRQHTIKHHNTNLHLTVSLHWTTGSPSSRRDGVAWGQCFWNYKAMYGSFCFIKKSAEFKHVTRNKSHLPILWFFLYLLCEFGVVPAGICGRTCRWWLTRYICTEWATTGRFDHKYRLERPQIHTEDTENNRK